MDKLLKLKEQRKAALDAAESIIDEAEKSEDGLTDEIRAKADEFIKAADTLESEIKQIETDEQRKAKIVQAQQDVSQAEERQAQDNAVADTSGGHTPQVTAPRYHGTLKAFRGANAQRDAYESGQWIGAVVYGMEGCRQWCRDNGVETRVLTLSTNTGAGYLAPAATINALIDLKEERGVLRRNADVVPMSTETVMVPRRTGGVTIQAVGENPSSDITASDPSVDQIELVARNWAGLTKVSRSLSEDAAISIADFVTSEMAYGMADKEDEAGFNGDGTSTYHGIFGAMAKIDDGNHAGSIYDAASGNTAFSTLDLADFEGALGQLPTYAQANARWYISREGFYASMARLMDAAGGNTIDTLAGGTGMQFLGRPVVITDVLFKTLTASTEQVMCLVGDLRQAITLGDRRDFSIQVLNELYAARLQTGILGWSRFDINVHELGDATNAGSLIGLKTPAS